MKNVIFLAPPLGGKGTFSDYLEKEFGYEHFSTGSILREKSLHDDFLKEILESGVLVSDDVILPLIDDVLQNRDQDKPFILDGFPRTIEQAKKLDMILSGLGIDDVAVIYINVKKETLVDRVIGRKVCSKCYRSYNLNIDKFRPKVLDVCDGCGSSLITRDDDNLESFTVRYNTYLKNTEPIISYYQEKKCLSVIQNDELSQEDSFEKLRSVIL